MRAGEGAGVSAGGTEALEDAGTAEVLGGCDPLEVGGMIVEDVAIEMVAYLSGERQAVDSRTDDPVGEQIIAYEQVL